MIDYTTPVSRTVQCRTWAPQWWHFGLRGRDPVLEPLRGLTATSARHVMRLRRVARRLESLPGRVPGRDAPHRGRAVGNDRVVTARKRPVTVDAYRHAVRQ